MASIRQICFKRRFLLVATVLFLLVGIVSGGITYAQTKKEVTWNDITGAGSPGGIATEAIARKFEERYPNIKVMYNNTEHELSKTLIRIWLTAQDPPDVIRWQGGLERMGNFVRRGLVKDITDLWKTQGYAQDFTKSGTERVTFDGKQYGIPFIGTFNGIFYRKSVWQEFGFTEPKSWDEFLTICEKSKGQGMTPIAMGLRQQKWPAAFWFTYLNLRMNGLDFDESLAMGEVEYTDPKVEKLFKTWKTLIDKGYFVREMGGYDWQEAATLVVRRNAAMYLMGAFIGGVFPEEDQSDIGVFPFPIMDSTVGVYELCYGDLQMSSANAPHPEEALMLLDFIASKEMQQLFQEMTGSYMEHKGIPKEMNSPYVRELADYYETIDGTISFYDRVVVAGMYDKALDAFVEFMLNPDKYEEIIPRLETYRQLYYAE